MSRRRKVGPVLATALVASNMIGSGIYLLPATLATVGSITILGWLFGGLGAMLVAATLAKLARLAPEAGGPCAHAGRAFGPYAGFQTTAIYWIQCVVGNGAIALAAVGYLASFAPALAQPLASAAAAAALIWIFTALNIIGPRLVCQFESASIAIGLVPILLVATLGWFVFDADVFRGSWNVSGEPAIRAVPASMVLIFWAFLGLESATMAAAVVENPERNVARATIAGVALAGIVYIGATAAIMGLIPARELSSSTAPFADAMRVMQGSVAGGFVAALAAVKALGTLAGWILVTAQIGKAGADRGIFPRFLGVTNGAGTPVRNLLVVATLMSAAVFATQSPTLGAQFNVLIEVAVILSLVVYIYACAVLALGRAPGAATVSTRSRALAAAAILFCAWVIFASAGKLLLVAALIVAATWPAYRLASRWRAEREMHARAEVN